MSECQVCTGRAELFLCSPCTSELRAALTALLARPVETDPSRTAPGWIELIEDAAIGQTRRGDGGHKGEWRSAVELDGRKGLAECIDLLPADDDDGKPDRLGRVGLARYRAHRAQLVRRQFLGAMRINGIASEQLDLLTNMLTTWCRDLCETRGITWAPARTVPWDFIGPVRLGWHRLPPVYTPGPREYAHWLRLHVHAIACHEGAGEFFDELREQIRTIERIINPPPEKQFCGPCPTPILATPLHQCQCEKQPATHPCDKRHPHPCGNRLMVSPGTREVTCRECGQTHKVDRLVDRMWNRLDGQMMTLTEIIDAYKRMLEPPPAARTIAHWRATGRLKIRGYKRLDGRRVRTGLVRHSQRDEPLYRFGDVKKLMADRPARRADKLADA